MTEKNNRRLLTAADDPYTGHDTKDKFKITDVVHNKDVGVTNNKITPPDIHSVPDGITDNVVKLRDNDFRRKVMYDESSGSENRLRAEQAERTKYAEYQMTQAGYQTNPMYEKLLKFRQMQQKKRFTVEDLLKW